MESIIFSITIIGFAICFYLRYKKLEAYDELVDSIKLDPSWDEVPGGVILQGTDQEIDPSLDGIGLSIKEN